MGSYRKAIMTGFICRLCSKHKNVVVHLYGTKSHNMQLLNKITLLPITIKKYDKLPKTICEACLKSLCDQFDLVQKITASVETRMKHSLLHSHRGCPSTCPFNGTVNEESSSSEENLTPGINNSASIRIDLADESNAAPSNSSTTQNLPEPDPNGASESWRPGTGRKGDHWTPCTGANPLHKEHHLTSIGC